MNRRNRGGTTSGSAKRRPLARRVLAKPSGKGPRALLAWLFRLVLLAVAALVALWALLIFAYRWVDPPLTPLMLIRLPVEQRLSHRPVNLDEIAPALARSVVAAEDNRFCTHRGVDWDAVRDVIGEYRDRGRVRGASTITMQLARNLFLWPGGGAPRKGVEIILAHAIDFTWPKHRVIEVYLNSIEWGHGIYGAEAAAQAHFGKPAAQLTGREAAQLAAVLPNPRRWSAGQPTSYIQQRAGVIQTRINQLGPLLNCLEAR